MVRNYMPLETGISLRQLDLERHSRSLIAAICNNWRRIKVLRASFRSASPDVIISFIDQSNVVTLLAASTLKAPVIISERVHPGRHRIGFPWRILRALLYPYASALVVQTAEVKRFFGRGISRKITIIPNPVSPPEWQRSKKPGHNIAAVGRLERQKGFDLLIDAFAGVAARHPEWRLNIWGEGSQRTQLEAQVKALGLQERVFLPGVTHIPGTWIQEADAFVLSSRYEGFPNALAEAMSAGLPCIAFDCPSGPAELMQWGGLLVADGDVAALAEAMHRVMSDSDLRERMGSDARLASARFHPDLVFAAWCKLLDQLVARRTESSI